MSCDFCVLKKLPLATTKDWLNIEVGWYGWVACARVGHDPGDLPKPCLQHGVCPSRASGERSCITFLVADWAAQTEALEAACPVGAAHQLGQANRCPATICGELVTSTVRASAKPVTGALVNATQANIRLDRFVGHTSRAVLRGQIKRNLFDNV